jgi:hypothetical protein
MFRECAELINFVPTVRSARAGCWSVVALVLSLAVFMPSAHGNFFDATDAAIGTYAFAAGSPALADYNNDGLLDVGAGYHIMRNNGPDGTGQTTLTNIGGIPQNGNAIFGDYDKDGFVDYFMSSYGRLYHNNGGNNFTLAQQFTGMPTKGRASAFVDINGDSYLDLYVGAFEACVVGCYQPDVIYLNNQNGTFSKQTSFVPGANPAYGVTTADWDEDGDVDIYVSNYRLETNFLWRNDGNGNLTNVSGTHNATSDSGHSMGAAFGDFDNDGDLDLFSGQFAHLGQPESRFLMNKGASDDFKFTDTGTRGVTFVESYASPTFGDIDNDGDLDLYFSTVYQENSKLWKNNFVETGNLTFTDISASWNIHSIVGTAQTTYGAFGDYNDDGRLDLFTANKLLENAHTSNNNWLKVRLEGNPAYDATAIGSQVRIEVPGLGTLTRQVEGAVGTDGNQNDHTMHFGLGSYDGPLTLEVRWPDGLSNLVSVSGVDQTITIAPEVLEDGTWSNSEGGSWNHASYWVGGVVPDGNSHVATLGSTTGASSTLYTNQEITVKKLSFDHSTTYAIAGTGLLNLESNSGSAQIDVQQGTHKLQVRVALKDDVTATVAGGAALEFNNRIDLNGHDLVKNGGGQLRINNTVVTGGGSVVGASGSITGSGMIVGDLENVEGIVAPGNSPGTLTIDGDYTQGSGGTLAIEIAGNTPGDQYDRLVISGQASLAGTLNVTLIDSFTPLDGDTFDILDFSSVSGDFDLLNLPGGFDWNWDVNTGVLSVGSVVGGLAGDYDGNGVVDAADYTIFQDNLGGDSAVLNGNGSGAVTVVQADYLRWVANFGSSAAGSDSSGAAVPEPSSLALVLLAGSLGLVRRRLG